MAHRFYELAGLSERLAATGSKRTRALLVGDFLKKIEPAEVPIAVNLIAGRVFPESDPRRLDLSWAAVFKVVREIAPVMKVSFADTVDAGEGVSDEDYSEAGPSDPVEKIMRSLPARKPVLGLIEVYRYFEGISRAQGTGARKKKEALLKELIGRSTPVEAKYIAKAVIGEMRHGVSDGIVQDGIARVSGVALKTIQRAAMLCGDLGTVAKAAIEKGDVSAIRLVLFRPVQPMLAQSSKENSTGLAQSSKENSTGLAQSSKENSTGLAQSSKENSTGLAPPSADYSTRRARSRKDYSTGLAQTANDVAAAFVAMDGAIALEYKYDGVRVQIHKAGSEVKIFSRRLTDITPALPEIVAAAKNLKAKKAIVDGEVIAVDRNGRPLPFQHVMRRLTRVKEIEKMKERVPVKLFLFDCLYADGELLIDRPYQERWNRLAQIRGGAELAVRCLPKNRIEGEDFLKEAMAAGQEGVMAKALDSPYTPGGRGKGWLKIKPAITLDLVIVAADWGYGRRHGWLSNYHLAAWDEDRQEFSVVGKTFKGLTDDQFSRITKALLDLKITEKHGTVSVQPQQVVEVVFNEIQSSTRYRSGMALRFARIARIRDDKSPKEIATIRELRRLFERQFITKGKMT